MSIHLGKQNIDLPNDEKIAASLGIDDLHIGRHYFRNNHRMKIGSVWIETFWFISVMPSFHNYGLVGLVFAHVEEHPDLKSPEWIKAILASNDSLVVQDIESDPLPPILARLPLLNKPFYGGIRDGIGYNLRFASGEIRGKLHFSNPVLPELLDIERSCWKLAEMISSKSSNKSLTTFIQTWQRYFSARHEKEFGHC